MDMRQKNKQTWTSDKKQTDIHVWTAKQTANKGTLGVYFGMSDKPYFDPYIFGKLHLKIHNTVR